MNEMVRLVHEGMDAGACGWSAQVLGATSVQRDYDGTPMITDLMTEHELLTFAKVLAERDEGFIELVYEETGEEGRPLPENVMNLFEKVADGQAANYLPGGSTKFRSSRATPGQVALVGELRPKGAASVWPRSYSQKRL
jgi:hypothetical protein